MNRIIRRGQAEHLDKKLIHDSYLINRKVISDITLRDLRVKVMRWSVKLIKCGKAQNKYTFRIDR